MKTGLFFGSFNPVHMGHLIIAEQMMVHAGLDEVWLVVSPQNPFKKSTDLLDAKHRVEMVRLATRDSALLKACDFELSLPTPSFTRETMKALEENYPLRSWVLIMGSDTAVTLPAWKDFENLESGYDMAVYPRACEVFDKPAWAHRMSIYHDLPLMHISASYIRKAIKAGKSVRYLVPDQVKEYIDLHGLYL